MSEIFSVECRNWLLELFYLDSPKEDPDSDGKYDQTTLNICKRTLI